MGGNNFHNGIPSCVVRLEAYGGLEGGAIGCNMTLVSLVSKSFSTAILF